MLKSVHHHVHSDTEIQESLEKDISVKLHRTFQDNQFAFRRAMPNTLPYLLDDTSSNIAILTNQNSQLNIVDFGTGRTVYGLDPEAEVRREYEAFTRHPFYISTKAATDEPSHSELWSPFNQLASLRYMQQPMASHLDVVVVLGIGLGHHLRHLIENHQIKHLLVYEPEVEYFKCSAQAVSWKSLIDTAVEKGTNIYLQLGQDGTNLFSHIEELRAVADFSGFYLYRHYNNKQFLNIEYLLANHKWQTATQADVKYTFVSKANVDVPVWTQALSLNDWQPNCLREERYRANLSAFEQFFPEIYQQFVDYEVKDWFPVVNQQGDVNVVQKHHLITLNGDEPSADGQLSVDGYAKQPNKDGLVLGYQGGKLYRYIHYKMVRKVQRIIDEMEDVADSLPDTIKSMIMFGLGTGYQLEALMSKYEVQHLYLCEPNPDFFHASLYALDWVAILERLDATESRLYINIGDDGTDLFRELLKQFYSVGAYTLANTYFYQGYFSEGLNRSATQLREQLQVIVSMGDYFDHARHGISHSLEAIRKQTPLLMANPSNRLARHIKEVPVFLVGNGPSLDNVIEHLHEVKDQVIIVSCGTSLRVLHQNGIQPDFHAEIEQNRATYDWVSRVGDFDYLKKITLLSCGGIHPDTMGLFKDVYLSFKEGESSTVSIMESLGNEDYFATLKYAFPTVTNMVVNLFAELGMTQTYLLGIDLGFHNKEYHHSKSSGYYDTKGKALYDYSARSNTSLRIAGNFTPYVFTKYEFKVAKSIIEQSIAEASGEYYNLSDGAKINGTMSLAPENIIVVSSCADKKRAIEEIKTKCYGYFPEAFPDHYTSGNDLRYLSSELSSFSEKLDTEITSLEEAEALIDWQRDFIHSSYKLGKTRLFFYVHGTINYINSVLTKSLYTRDCDQKLNLFNEILVLWRQTFKDIKDHLLYSTYAYDIVDSFRIERQVVYLAESMYSEDYSIGANDTYLASCLLKEYKALALQETDNLKVNPAFVLRELPTDIQSVEPTSIYVCRDEQRLDDCIAATRVATVIYLPGDVHNTSDSVDCTDTVRVQLALKSMLCVWRPVLAFPRPRCSSMEMVSQYFDIEKLKYAHVYEHDFFYCLSRDKIEENDLLLVNGDRLALLPRELELFDIVKDDLVPVDELEQIRAQVVAEQ